MSSIPDAAHMARALELAERGRYTTDPNPRVGCVVARDDRIVGEGWHQWAGASHAEPMAIAQAGEQAKGATLYVSLEPCCHQGRTPPCTDAIIAAGISRVVAAMQDPHSKVGGRGFDRLRAAGITVECGLMASQARALNPGFVKRHETGLPYVRVKLAMSLDGRTAMADGESKWITGEDARRDVQRLRASSSAILTGAGTVLADDPALNVRLSPAELQQEADVGRLRQPLRVVLDPLQVVGSAARILAGEEEALIICGAGRPRGANSAVGVPVVEVPAVGDRLDLHAVLMELGKREVNEVLIESGATLAGAFVQAGLVDELIVYLAPHLMGHQGRGLFNLPLVSRMRDRIEVSIQEVRAVGRDWRITAIPTREA